MSSFLFETTDELSHTTSRGKFCSKNARGKHDRILLQLKKWV